MSKVSPFLDPGPLTTPGALALVHLSRDNVVPVYLKNDSGNTVDGYTEGSVINTRFGSFPHSTLISQPWGSQIRASIVDTGSRGRKRKLGNVVDPDTTGNDTEAVASSTSNPKDVRTAPTGFIHVLPPTPEIWTSSLPHRTQVVYTPDYSYILHRIRARPGTQLIEAGSGSGSFTHAATRAVYNGYPKSFGDKRGKVWSFEFNHDRFLKMREDVQDHRLSGLVQVTHRDVYNDGFLVDNQSPEAECIFLDVPAPWQALPHLSRTKPTPSQLASCGLEPLNDASDNWVSPLCADQTVHICTFSPCIEQVTKTVEVMRRLGWMEIEMVEVAQRRINVLREKVGLNMPLERGTNQSPRNVVEAVTRLKQIDSRFKEHHKSRQDTDVNMEDIDAETSHEDQTGAADDAAKDLDSGDSSISKPWMAGRLTHRTEAEIKTHTSYLVFALLPQKWSEEQEAAAFEKWPCGKESKVIGSLDKETRKKEKRELLCGNKQKKMAASSTSSPVAKKSKI
ncbi:tRNA methyltransferase complex GCD14 subunit [Xylaria bambusicola]|uniref:tRNA methyltransferase complex GCD14 subunit n=1 Tax=Xylaria bambusicola TaxID=326684 RepID=UPI0020080644|nr:tRNA methyltransferase complex GCD14 subunit [Xylaria bambusicola]KAI0525494.1 tRNA methyltransferase complex GCD14 subunit [Xylaria bambusicola]